MLFCLREVYFAGQQISNVIFSVSKQIFLVFTVSFLHLLKTLTVISSQLAYHLLQVFSKTFQCKKWSLKIASSSWYSRRKCSEMQCPLLMCWWKCLSSSQFIEDSMSVLVIVTFMLLLYMTWSRCLIIKVCCVKRHFGTLL